MSSTDTIAAIATAAGAGGIGVVRISGDRARAIAQQLCGLRPKPRHAHYARFHDGGGDVIDDGIVLYFRAPASYTGEDVIELQVHGSIAVLRQLLARCLALGARPARPGEFSERAFLNGKLDLVQAEAVADLIAAGDLRAARAARRSLDGVFSRRVDALAQAVLRLRVHLEATIDFVDEPLETLGGHALREGLGQTNADLQILLVEAERGQKLRDGLHAVIVGPPNAGKSSLLNALAGSDRAIVSATAGTTRDVLRETVFVEGIELTLVDTAGLREGGSQIEREGMRRAETEVGRADLALIVLDARDPDSGIAAVADIATAVPERIWVYNKIDLLPAGTLTITPPPAFGDHALGISVRTGMGLTDLHARLARVARGGEGAEGTFSARARQVLALRRAQSELTAAREQLDRDMLELAAESLRAAHDHLGEITGRVAPDDLLGHIFSSFCIGK
ncbi:MAG: tRNA uridine-5-carboxymethylaminomethyl(34) synthesis GTPase MnmE [Lysobacteraceae bacterium]|nr:MAG: tRNA uridine-5-carboxymethylaminomethyl(34) synthesis GTPase MnmE [Xanthomonadaceae bacterium]